MSTISYQTGLIYVMVIAAVAEGKLHDHELLIIIQTIKLLPLFQGFTSTKLNRIAGDCAALLDNEEGLDAVLGLVKESLPEKLYGTAYSLACDVSRVSGPASREKLRWLEMLRKTFALSPLHASAIEYTTRIRHYQPHSIPHNRYAFN